MKIEQTAIDGVLIVEPAKHGDHRGFFSEVFNAGALAKAGLGIPFVQDNHSLSAARGVVRGLHFQLPPFAQDKLVRVVRGAVLDVAVDLREGSPTYGQYVAVELSADNWRQLFIPKGFAHGFCTLTENVEFLHKVSAPYSAAHDCGVAWDDPAIGVRWPVTADDAILSDKDRKWPGLRELERIFELEAA